MVDFRHQRGILREDGHRSFGAVRNVAERIGMRLVALPGKGRHPFGTAPTPFGRK